MIPLDRIKSSKEGDIFIYESPNEPGRFYSGRAVKRPEGVIEPIILCLVPTDKRLRPFQLVGEEGMPIGKRRYLETRLGYNWGIAFQVSQEDLTGDRDLRQNLSAQAKEADYHASLAVPYVINQLPEIRRNFEVLQ